MPRVVGYGDAIVDRFIDRKIAYPGGNSVNVAVMARRAGASSAFVGVCGDDSDGAIIQRALEAEDIDTQWLVVRNGETGYTDIVTINNERQFREWNHGGVTMTDPYQLEADGSEWALTADLIHTGVYAPTTRDLPGLRAKSAGAIIYDFSDEAEHRSPHYLTRVCPWVDIAVFSCGSLTTEETDQTVSAALHAGASIVLASRGSAGAVVASAAAVMSRRAVPVPPQQFIDTMGCGDALLTGFAVTLWRSGWRRDSPVSPEQLTTALDSGLREAAQQCQVEAAFGHGRRLTERDGVPH